MTEEMMAQVLPAMKPVLALITWTLIMWLWLYATRIPAMQKLRIDPQDAKHPGTYADRLPAQARSVADNYNHLHEQPTIFYALAIFIALTGGANTINLALLWGYVALRVVHSLIQSTVNIVMVRFAVFVISTVLLIILTIREVLRIFL